MGKTTLYHPVPLSVIRGAAEYCGWKFGKITQLFSDTQNKTALYSAVVVDFPERVKKMSIADTRKDLQRCFMDDIIAEALRETKGGVWLVDLKIDTNEK